MDYPNGQAMPGRFACDRAIAVALVIGTFRRSAPVPGLSNMRKKQHNRAETLPIMGPQSRRYLPLHDRNVCIWQLPDDIFCKRRCRRACPGPGLCGGLPAIEPARAQSAGSEPAWRHALSLFGDVKYPADFKRFDYVNPDAPKGGVARQIAVGTFDNFNIVVAGVKGIARRRRRARSTKR